jgi:RNA polymerase sigma factor (sigma-70 family)
MVGSSDDQAGGRTDAAVADAALLDAWCGGDQRAGNALFERHFRGLYGFFRNKIADGIDDLVQQTFLACVRGRDGFRREASFRTYMFAVAKNVLYREWERRRRGDALVELGAVSVHELGPGVSTAYARHREQRLLLDALRRLPLDFQVTLELYYFEGCSGPEIAEILGIPEATVRSRINRGSKQLRRRVEELAKSPDLLRSTIDGLDGWTRSLRPALQGGPDGGE